MLSFEENEDLAKAKELLPTFSPGAQAHSDPLLEPPTRLLLLKTGIGPSLFGLRGPRALPALARSTSRTC